jgi:ubiquinone/menaquinone biosynthesis C-methylase UbiE
MSFRRIAGVTKEDVAHVWDNLAHSRYEDILSGSDRSYTQVLLPLISDFIKKNSGGSLLDVGCGVGFVAKEASRYFDRVDAIDLSQDSILIARERNFESNISYHIASVEGFESDLKSYDVVVCSMALMDCNDLQGFLRSCASLAGTKGRLIFTLCHPFFWPRYWGFEKCKWFSYNAELAILSKFRTSSTGVSDYPSIYFHRPISLHINCLSSNGFSIDRIREISGLTVKSKVLNKFPRYLCIEASIQ